MSYATGPSTYGVTVTPALAYDNVYVASRDYNLYCLPQEDPDGDGVIEASEVIWSFSTGDYTFTTAAVANGKVYVGSTDENLYCLNAFDGDLIWSYETHDHVLAPAVADGRVYARLQLGFWKIYCFGTPLPACDVLPTSLAFYNVAIGSYLDKSFTIENTGGEVLSGIVSEVCDHYEIISGDGEYNLGAGESREVTVRFKPTLEGFHQCTIETGSGICEDVSCQGEAVTPQIPTLSQWGIVAMILTLTGLGAWNVRRRRSSA